MEILALAPFRASQMSHDDLSDEISLSPQIGLLHHTKEVSR